MAPATDDRWNELVSDLAARVAVYAPDWTDSNESDPGITILELFAFLGESFLDRPPRDPSVRTRLVGELTRLEQRARADCGDAKLTRPRYLTGQLLTASDLEDEQAYHRAKHRRHNRLLHGTGIVSGLDVAIDGAGKGGKPVLAVSPGVAIDPYGEELVLCQPVTSRLPPKVTRGYVTIRLAERSTAAQPGGEATRIEESAEITVQEGIPAGSIPLARLVRERETTRIDVAFQPPRVVR